MMMAADYLALARAARTDGREADCRREVLFATVAATDERDWTTYYHSLACMGRLLRLRGELDEAREWFVLARDAAVEHGLSEWRGPAEHDLLVVACDAGNRDAAYARARPAWDAYGERHPRISAYLADLAVLREQPERWAAYFAPFLLDTAPRADRIVGLTRMVQHMAGRGDRSGVERMLGRLMGEVAAGPEEGAALCLVTAAEAAGRAGVFGEGEAAASWALDYARKRGEAVVAQRAGHALDYLRARRTPPT